jgi:hypothetical protein
MGKPIVSTDADGLTDILTDPPDDAVVVPKRNGQALAEEVVALLRSPNGARRSGARRASPAPGTTSRPSSARWSGSTTCSTRPRAAPAAPGSSTRTWRSSRGTSSGEHRPRGPAVPAALRARRRPVPGVRRLPAGLRALGRLPSPGVRLPERRRHLLQPGVEPGGRSRLQLRAPRSRAGLEGVPDRPRGHLPEEGQDALASSGPTAFPSCASSSAARPAERSALLRQVVHLPAPSRAIRAPVRHERLSRVARAAADRLPGGGLRVPPRAVGARGGRGRTPRCSSRPPRCRSTSCGSPPRSSTWRWCSSGSSLWCYKEVADPLPGGRVPGRWGRWLRAPGSDLAAASCSAVAAFSKPTNIVAAGPMLLMLLLRRQLAAPVRDRRHTRAVVVGGALRRATRRLPAS